MDFFLQNIFIWCLEAQKTHVVPTDYCQFYGLPFTSHVISAQILADFLGSIFGQNKTDSSRLVQHVVFLTSVTQMKIF